MVLWVNWTYLCTFLPWSHMIVIWWWLGLEEPCRLSYSHVWQLTQSSARTLAEAISLMHMQPLVVAWASSLNGAWVPRRSILRESRKEEASSPVNNIASKVIQYHFCRIWLVRRESLSLVVIQNYQEISLYLLMGRFSENRKGLKPPQPHTAFSSTIKPPPLTVSPISINVS